MNSDGLQVIAFSLWTYLFNVPLFCGSFPVFWRVLVGWGFWEPLSRGEVRRDVLSTFPPLECSFPRPPWLPTIPLLPDPLERLSLSISESVSFSKVGVSDARVRLLSLTTRRRFLEDDVEVTSFLESLIALELCRVFRDPLTVLLSITVRQLLGVLTTVPEASDETLSLSSSSRMLSRGTSFLSF